VPHWPSAEAHEQTWGVGETRLGREPPGSRGQPEGVAQEGRRMPKLLAARIARVSTWTWDTSYGEQRMGLRVLPTTLRLL